MSALLPAPGKISASREWHRANDRTQTTTFDGTGEPTPRSLSRRPLEYSQLDPTSVAAGLATKEATPQIRQLLWEAKRPPGLSLSLS